MAKTRYGTWTKNFGQSVKFSAKSVLTEIAPNISETAASLHNDIQELRRQTNETRNFKQMLMNALDPDGNVSKYSKETLKNIKDSLKTGKFHDQAREDRLMNESMDMDFDFDLDDDLDFGSVKIGPQKVLSSSGASAISSSLGRGFAGTNTAIAKGFSALNEAEKSRMSVALAVNQRYYGTSIRHLNAIEQNSAALVKFNNESMSVMVQGALKYYDDSLQLMREIRDAVVPSKKEGPGGYSGDGIDDIFYGGFSLSNYINYVKKNMASNSSNSAMGSMLGMLTNPMMVGDIIANPMGALLTFGLKSLVPASLKNRLGRTDAAFKEFMPAALDRLGRYNGDNSILSMLSETFGVRRARGSDKYKTNQYERGPIPYDGESKKALTEVIPSYLSKIAYSLDILVHGNKAQQLIYDWSDSNESGGKFITMGALRSRHESNVRDAKLSGYSDARWAVGNALTNLFGYGEKTDALNSNFEKLLINLVDSNANFNPKDIKQLSKYFGNDARTMAAIFAGLNPNILMSITGSGRLEGRQALSRYYYNNALGNTTAGASSLGNLYNGIYDPLSQISGTQYYKNDSSTGIYKDDNGRWTISKDSLATYNRRYNTNFKNVKQVMEHFDSMTKNSSSNMEKFLKDTEGMTDAERDAYIKAKTQASNMEFNDTDNRFSSAVGRLFRSPITFIESGLAKIDNLMYKVIFGMGEDDDSIFKNVVEGIKGTFTKIGNWMETNIFNPIKQRILGSELAAKAKKGFKGFFLGEQDKDGKYSGGLFSPVLNGTKDLWGDVKKEWKDDVLPKIKSLGDDVNEYIFGKQDPAEKGEKKPIMETVMDKIHEGFNWWSSLFFGKGVDASEKDQEKSGRVMMAKFKKAMPKGIQGGIMGAIGGTVSGLGGFGMLGSLFLPGGPIGGAIVGTALGFASQSKKFREMIFGKEEVVGKDKEGKDITAKVGGLISDKIQKFFKGKRSSIVGGALLGTGSYLLTGGMAFGLMPSLAIGAFGPVLAGAAMGLASHSETLKEAIFGSEKMKEDGTIERVGGIINKESFDRFKKAIPRGLAGALGSVAGFSILGNMGMIGSMLALGPIPAAITGAGIGIMSASKNFTDAMFGYTDDKGEIHEGILGRMRNFFMVRIFKPLSIFSDEVFAKTSHWFKQNIAFPIANAFIPIKVAATKIGDNIIDSISKAMNEVGDGMRGVFTKIGEKVLNVFDKILTPLESFGRGLMSAFGTAMTISAKLALAPLTIAGGMANAFVKGGSLYTGFKVAAGNLMTGSLSNPFGFKDEYAQQIDEERAALKEKSNAEQAAYSNTKADLAGQWKSLHAEQKGFKSRGYRKEASRLAKIDKAINTSEDPNVALNAAQLNKQSQMSESLLSIKDSLGKLVAKFIPALASDDNAKIAHQAHKEEEKETAKFTVFRKMGKMADKFIGKKVAKKLGGTSDGGGDDDDDGLSFFDHIKSIVSGVGQIGRLVAIGTGIAGGLMLLYSWLTGETDNPETQKAMNESIAMDRAQRHGTYIATKGGLAIGRGIQGVLGYKGIGSKIGKTIAKPFEKVYDKFKGKPIEEGGKGNMIARGMKSVIDRVFSKDGLLAKIASPDKIEKLRKIFINLVDTITSPENMKKIVQKIPGAKIAGAAVRTVGMASPIALGFGIYDAVTGLTRTAELFDVAEEDVNWTMRIVSTVLNVVMGYGVMKWIDLGLSALSLGVISMQGTVLGQLCARMGLPLTDFDHHKLIARVIYTVVLGEDDLEAKQNRKSSMEEAAAKAVQAEYDKYKSIPGAENISFEQFQSQKDSVWNKYFAGTVSRLTGTNAYIFNDPNKPQPESLLARLKGPFDRVVEWFTGFGTRLDRFGFIGMVKLLLGYETEESLQQQVDAGKDMSVFGRIKEGLSSWFSDYLKNSNKNYASAGFAGGGFEDESNSLTATATNKKADMADSTGIPYYWTQNDPRYANTPVAPNADPKFGTMSQFGCAPTALAMVSSMYNGYAISPTDAARYIQKSDLRYGDKVMNKGVGISESYFAHAAAPLSLTMDTSITNSEELKQALMSGKAVIMGGRRLDGQTENETPFTDAGHYVVVKGYNPHIGTAFVYDPLGKKSRSYNPDELMKNIKYGPSFLAAFSHSSGSNPAGGNPEMALNPEVVKLPKSVRAETGDVDLDNLTKNAKEAMEYMGKYHRYLTGRVMVVSSGYRTTGTMGDHTTGNCFDVVDDATHETLENNEKGIRAKMIQEAGRLGIKVIDEYEIDTPYKTGGHLHMDATNWLQKPYNTGITGKIKNTITSIMDIFGSMGSSFLDMAMATLAGKRWTPNSEGDDGYIPETGDRTISLDQVYRYYKDKGYSDAAIAAIMGNIRQESNFSGVDTAEYKAADGYTYGGVGLFQWNGDRTQALKDWAKSINKDYQDPGVQMAYMFKEASENSAYQASPDFMSNNFADSIEGAALAAEHFGKNYEICGVPGNRVQYAREFYTRIKNGEFAGAGDMGRVASTYAAQHPVAQLNLANNNRRYISSANLSPNSVLRSSANIIELVNAIQRIDVHDELNQMIDILQTIAENGGGNINVISREAGNKEIARLKKVPRPKGFNDKGLQRMIDTMEANDEKSGLALAYQIASGGEFRKR